MAQEQTAATRYRLFKIGALAAAAFLTCGLYLLLFDESGPKTSAPSSAAVDSFEIAFMSKLFEQNCLQRQQMELLQQKIQLLQHLVEPWQFSNMPKWQQIQQKIKQNQTSLEVVQQTLGAQESSGHFEEHFWQQFKSKYQNSTTSLLKPHTLTVDLQHLQQYQEQLEKQVTQNQEKKKHLKQLYHDTDQKLAQQHSDFVSLQNEHKQQEQEYQTLSKQQILLRQQLKQLQQRTGVFGPVVTAEQDIVPVQRIHILSTGESLASLARYYYGNGERWNEIYEANRNLIADANDLKVGSTLVIP